MYELVGLEDTSEYNCLQHCVYQEMMEQRSEHSGDRFCFAAGDLEVACREQEEGTEETEQNNTEEPAGDSLCYLFLCESFTFTHSHTQCC